MKLLIAGGGTGGHLFPGIAVAEEVVRRGGEVLFVGTARGIEARVLPAAGYVLETIDVVGLKRTGVMGQVRGLARLPGAYFRSRAILKKFRPDVVLGVGGYASGPLVMTAALSRVPCVIHEGNSVPGITNRILAHLVRAVLIAFDDARPFFSARKVEFTGNPVRAKLVAALSSAAPPASASPRVLVVGGSQGARGVNELVMAAVKELAAKNAVPQILHQSGQPDFDRCVEHYRGLGLGERVQVQPFIEDMAAAYGNADLVIGRAGALTLSELAIAGRPAILIPLPTAADDHQTKNAGRFVEAGAALMLDQRTATGTDLATMLTELSVAADRRATMSIAMRTLARPHAAQAIVDRLEKLAG